VVRQAEALVHAGFTVVSYDGRGHGVSEGSCTLGDLEALDVAAARTVITADPSIRPDLPVIVVGASMGAIAALRFAAANPDALSAVVAISSPATWHVPRTAQSLLASGLTQTRLGRLLCRRLLHTRLAPAWTNAEPPLSLVARITVPIALVHGESDRFLRSAEAVELYRSCRNPRRLDVVPGMGHAYHGLAVAPVVAAVEWALAASSRELIPA
jgi:alpha-beta hydrolase superfamily lysophospholipase